MKLKTYLNRTIHRNAVRANERINKAFIERAIKCGIIEEDEYVYIPSLNRWNPEVESFCCEHCSEWFPEGEANSVHTSQRRMHLEATWCTGCRDEDSFYCTSSSEYWSCDEFSAVRVDGVRVCYESCQDDLYYWDSTDSYHWEPEPDEEDEQPRDGVPGYHTIRKTWRSGSVIVGREIPWEYIGAELEVFVNKVESLPDVCDKAESLGLIAERDGSLDCAHGIELVGPPIVFKKYRAGDVGWKDMLQELRSVGSKAWDAGTGYGMHLSVNRAGMSRLHNAKFCYFINSNKKLCEAVAGRPENSWARYVNKTLPRSRRDSGKYEAAANRSERRTEVRIFRSTLKWESFLKNVEFVHAVLKFTHDCSAAKLKTGEFIKFFRQHRKTYIHLDEWLRNRNGLAGLEQ